MRHLMRWDWIVWEEIESFQYCRMIISLYISLLREVNMVLDEQWNKENERKR